MSQTDPRQLKSVSNSRLVFSQKLLVSSEMGHLALLLREKSNALQLKQPSTNKEGLLRMRGRMGRTRVAHRGMVWYGMVWYGMVWYGRPSW